ncbi:LLM class flavin-dependent oxidoreductase [Acinetobacter sp.]|uniref:LLM class flavin-dependent oxidoreductase n=1 Tax=Acinetobacter sp. TaxID=472 RepID=UPI0026491F80|nr:LLM class flavin-dependent oxidoreductase [Acinetobacter sp.]MDN5513105.1 LLM class flavin-dependent oxidoreductase [Acinetobacter sp.]MDN5525676.1 LLM class flavin-dependent oxidoreductase [Acinetobacter sp.]
MIVQAGSSDQGRDFAAQYADIVFTMQPSAEEAKVFYRDVKERVAKYERKLDELKVFQGITPFAADTAAKAEEIKKNWTH